MHQDKCIEIARAAAVDCNERHDYMPATPLLAETWLPHRWVVDAMQTAVCDAELQRDQYRNGNTTLLKALMASHEDTDDANALRADALREAGMLNADGSCNWHAIEARAPTR